MAIGRSLQISRGTENILLNRSVDGFVSRLEITHINELVGNVLNVDVTSLDGLQDVLLSNTATRSDRFSDSETYSLVETMTIPPMLG